MNDRLPQLDRVFVTDAGLETDFIYNRGFDLPCFAAITLLQNEAGRTALEEYFRSFLALAQEYGTGCLLESASWRAGRDWAQPLGLSLDELADFNHQAVTMLAELKKQFGGSGLPIVVSGCIGPRGDGYDPGTIMTSSEAHSYHGWQANVLAAARPDLLSAITMTNMPEAIGIAQAARDLALPVVISFTVETDGRIPAGETIEAAIRAVDAATDCYPAYYMINCAHPTHFMDVLGPGEWSRRIGGVRANASCCSHAELDRMTELDSGNPAELAQLYRQIRQAHPQIQVLGGCCGTDLRHITEIAKACVAAPIAAAN